jgi:hypothetical protein
MFIQVHRFLSFPFFSVFPPAYTQKILVNVIGDQPILSMHPLSGARQTARFLVRISGQFF